MPTLIPINARDDDSARDQALRELARSQHHRSVEVRGPSGVILRHHREDEVDPPRS